MTAAHPDTFLAWVLIVLSQCAGVVGDAFGQRTVRVVHKHSRRRMMISFVLVSSLQVFLVLGVLQIALPASVTGEVYIHGKSSQCYTQYFETGCCPKSGPSCSCVVNCTDPSSMCTAVPCPSQGPGSLFAAIQHHPFLLINGLANTVYYFAESMLYQQPLGLVFIVVASLFTSIFFKPIGALFDLPDSYVSPGVLFLGCAGAVLCVIEKVRMPLTADISERDSRLSGSSSSTSDHVASDTAQFGTEPTAVTLWGASRQPVSPVYNALERADGPYSALLPQTHRGSFSVQVQARLKGQPLSTFRWRRVLYYTLGALRILPAFIVLSLCYCLWFVFMKYFNDLYRLNAWGFNSYDQVTLPLFIFPALAAVSVWKPMRSLVETHEEGKSETFVQSFKHALQELTSSWSAFWTVFTYRFVTNARAVAYSYLAILYDLDVVYVELTLIRVVTSWIGAIIVTTCAPKFIHTDAIERHALLEPLNLAVKVVGTAAVVGALFLLSS